MKTGFKDLDNIVKIKGGDLIIVASRPAMGKTTFMLSIMENILLKNKRCLYFSLEMSKEQVITRLLFQIAEISFIKSKINAMNEKDWEKLSDAMNNLLMWDLKIDDNSILKTEEIEMAIKEQQPDVVFIDYLQLMDGKRKPPMIE